MSSTEVNKTYVQNSPTYSNSEAEDGVLYVVATPIGNLDDITIRAARVLGDVDCVVAEDTRHTQKLLQHLGIAARTQALHEHNERRVAPEVARLIADGGSVALVSDAGTPLISDPGYVLVDLVRSAGGRVVPIPGASAVTAALSASGLPTHRFAFEGFLPARRGPRLERLTSLQGESRTLVFYEAPHRVSDCLEDLVETMGADRTVAVAKELTKLHEGIFRGPVAAALQWLQADPARARGEFVIMVGAASEQQAELAVWDPWLRALLSELPPARASRLLAHVAGIPRKQIYRRALELNSDDGG
ncbi:MAG: 16S rRNA (cytidine(1402)-2'-O)-methyltransferase [Pseudomonadota bacterium]